jgi:hypothetical protein
MTSSGAVGVGLVWFNASDCTEKTIRTLARRGIRLASPGRLLTAIWEAPTLWQAQPPYEAWVIDEVLGTASARHEENHDYFSYFAHITIRLYGRDDLNPTRAFHALLLRRSGAPAYHRRSERAALRSRNTLAVAAPSFTRDYANDIWHLADSRDAPSIIVSRIAALTAWTDEDIIHLTSSGTRKSRRGIRSSTFDLVPVPTKVSYTWIPAPSAHQPIQLQLLD